MKTPTTAHLLWRSLLGVGASLPFLAPMPNYANEPSSEDAKGEIVVTVASQAFAGESLSPALLEGYRAQAGADLEEIGLVAIGGAALNEISVPVYKFVGECPGRATGSQATVFTSSKTPPAPDLRVVIRNVTVGVASDPYPYTDREYESGYASEETNISLGGRHSKKYFHVIPNRLNRFEYEIRQDDAVIERGQFAARVNSREVVQERNRRRVEEQYCSTGQPLHKCDDDNLRVRYVMKCPGE